MENRGIKRKYVSITQENKQKILTALKSGQSPQSLAQQFNVNVSTIYNIKKGENAQQNLSGNFAEYRNLNNRMKMRRPKYEQVDQCLWFWFRQMRARDFPVTGDMILLKAEFFNLALSGDPSWKPSAGFLRTFKNRYGIRSKQLSGEIASADVDAASEYVANYELENEGFDKECSYNADESSLAYRALPDKSLVEPGDACQVKFQGYYHKYFFKQYSNL